jgi:hypothetical protein
MEIHTKVLKLCSAVFHKFFGQEFEEDNRPLQMAGRPLGSSS